MAKTILCPFCFRESKLTALVFRCSNTDCSGRAPDPVYVKEHGGSMTERMGHVFQTPTPSRKWWKPWQRTLLREAECPICEEPTRKRLCPHCHFELMHDAGLIDEQTIAVLGATSSGKSLYIATLIHRLQNEVSLNFTLSTNAMTDATRTRYRQDFYEPVFKEKRALPPTSSATLDQTVKQPLIFRITFGQGRTNKVVNLVLFDTAGEDMTSEDTLSRYMAYADGLIFLLDPLQIEAVRQQLPQDVLPAKVVDAHPVDIIERLIHLYETTFDLKPGDTIKKPVAFSLSKIDMILPLLDAGSPLHSTGEHFGRWNEADSLSVHLDMMAYLNDWLGQKFQSTVSTYFDNYRFFGISALGDAPENDRQLKTVSPFRVEDPLLWIFHSFDLIDTME